MSSCLTTSRWKSRVIWWLSPFVIHHGTRSLHPWLNLKENVTGTRSIWGKEPWFLNPVSTLNWPVQKSIETRKEVDSLAGRPQWAWKVVPGLFTGGWKWGTTWNHRNYKDFIAEMGLKGAVILCLTSLTNRNVKRLIVSQFPIRQPAALKPPTVALLDPSFACKASCPTDHGWAHGRMPLWPKGTLPMKLDSSRTCGFRETNFVRAVKLELVKIKLSNMTFVMLPRIDT